MFSNVTRCFSLRSLWQDDGMKSKFLNVLSKTQSRNKNLLFPSNRLDITTSNIEYFPQDRQLGDPIRSAIIDHAIAERSANFKKKLIAEIYRLADHRSDHVQRYLLPTTLYFKQNFILRLFNFLIRVYTYYIYTICVLKISQVDEQILSPYYDEQTQENDYFSCIRTA